MITSLGSCNRLNPPPFNPAILVGKKCFSEKKNVLKIGVWKYTLKGVYFLIKFEGVKACNVTKN